MLRYSMMRRALMLGTCSAALVACAVPDVGNVTGTQEGTAVVTSEQGALAYYQGVLDLYGAALSDYAIESGTLTDELRPIFYANVNVQVAGQPSGIDARVLPEGNTFGVSFTELQKLRANARQARSSLTRYAPAAPQDLIGHLYAVEGLADVLLADLYCSGIPLSTVNQDGSFTLRAGSATHELYRTAITLFDSAITLAADSTRIRDFATLGKARALLALGHVDSAAALVTSIPTEYAYTVASVSVASGRGGMLQFNRATSYKLSTGVYSGAIMSDRDGGTGLPYATSGDPRTVADTGVSTGLSPYDHQRRPLLYPRYFAQKYAMDGTTPMVVASGVEARLIEAEAALRAGQIETWAQQLNDLRTASGIAPLPADSTTEASDAVRISVMFAERGYWLFLTGHRQGDLRRLVRANTDGGYGQPQAEVYPSGPYPMQTGYTYGSDVTLPVPAEEQRRNPHYDGCQNRDA